MGVGTVTGVETEQKTSSLSGEFNTSSGVQTNPSPFKVEINKPSSVREVLSRDGVSKLVGKDVSHIDAKDFEKLFKAADEKFDAVNAEKWTKYHEQVEVLQETLPEAEAQKKIQQLAQETYDSTTRAKYEYIAENDLDGFKRKYPEFSEDVKNDYYTSSPEEMAHRLDELRKGTVAGSPAAMYSANSDENYLIEDRKALSKLDDALVKGVKVDSQGTELEFSGKRRELKAVVKMHEAEHAVTENNPKNEENFINYLDENLEANGYSLEGKTEEEIKSDLEEYKDNYKEIDADIAAVDRASGVVSDKTVDWYVDARVARSTFHEVNSRITGGKTGTDTAHDTGVFVKEYQATGEAPDYLSMRNAMDGFYDKTAATSLEQLKASGVDPSTMTGGIPLSAISDVVRTRMAQEDTGYNSREMVVAQHFQNSMENLEVEPETVKTVAPTVATEAKVEKAIEQKPAEPEKGQPLPNNEGP